jgi:hypothetical protein
LVECLQIRLDTRTPRWVRAGDGQSGRQASHIVILKGLASYHAIKANFP